MVIEKLRAATKQTHEELEQAMFPLIQGITDAKGYAKLLHLFYGYYKPLENGIDLHLDRQVLTDYNERRKTDWILRDLEDIAQANKTIALDNQAPLIQSNAAAFGALYVMEGSTLGGKIICKTIGENLSIPDKKGLSFFYGYGSEAASRWKYFLSALDQYSGKPEEEEIVSTANLVFKNFRSWIKNCD